MRIKQKSEAFGQMPQNLYSKIKLHSVWNATPKWQWTTGKIMRKSLLRNSQRLGQMVFWVKNVSIPAHKKPTTTLPPLLFSSKWPKMRSNMSLMASSFEKLSLTTMISFSIFCFSSNGQVQFHLAVVKWCLLAKKPCNFMRCPDFLTQILIFGWRPNAKIETASLTFIQLDLWCQRKVKISGKPF